jgi:hypothetical protein
MAHARTTFLNSHLRWVKPGLWALLVGVVNTISTVIGAASNAVPVILSRLLHLRRCLSRYAERFQKRRRGLA